MGDEKIGHWTFPYSEPRQFKCGKHSEARLALSADGRLLAVAAKDRHVLHLYDLVGEKLIHRPYAGPRGEVIESVEFSADGKRVASRGHGGAARFWDPATGREAPRPESWTSRRDDQEAPVWRPSPSTDHIDGKAFGKFDGKAFGKFLGSTLEGRVLVSTPKGNQMRFWDLDTGRQIGATAEGNGENLTFSPNGKMAAWTWGYDVRLWDIVAGRSIHQLTKCRTAPGRVRISPDGKSLMLLCDGQVRVWDTGTGQEYCSLLANTSWRRFSPDGKSLILVSTGKVHVWQTGTRQARCFPGPITDPTAVVLSADGKTMAFANRHDFAISVLDLVTGKERRLQGHQGRVLSLAFAPDGKTMVSAGEDATILVWDLTREAAPRARLAPPIDLATCWADLTQEHNVKVARAQARLAAVIDRSVPFLKERLQPAEATAEEKRTARLIVDLSSDSFKVRQKAFDDLEKLGKPAEVALRQSLQGKPTLDLAQRVEKLLGKLKGPTEFTADQRRARNAVAVLKELGTQEARQVLEAVAKGAPEAFLTREAKAALARMAERPRSKGD
jgi:WD40 repeat protein